jgi:glycosyltransferase involved in cell wall biosynthesis
MRHGKPVVVSDIAAVRDYVEPGVSGYLVRDLATELPQVIAGIEANPEAASKIGEAAKVKYQGSFSRAALSDRFQKILAETESRAVL